MEPSQNDAALGLAAPALRAIDLATRTLTLDNLRATGRTTFRVVRRSALQLQFVALLQAVVDEREGALQGEFRRVMETREEEAEQDGRLRVLTSVVDLCDLVDTVVSTLGDGDALLAAKSLDRRLDRVFRTYGFGRIQTVGFQHDLALHEVVDEAADKSQPPGVIEPLVERAMRVIADTLRKNPDGQLRPGDVTDVILVGGSCLIPVFRRRIAEYFGREGRITIDGGRRNGSGLSGDPRQEARGRADHRPAEPRHEPRRVAFRRGPPARPPGRHIRPHPQRRREGARQAHPHFLDDPRWADRSVREGF